jgi:hypothetical protein
MASRFLWAHECQGVVRHPGAKPRPPSHGRDARRELRGQPCGAGGPAVKLDAELGENLAIDGLLKTAEVYARAAMRCCERP